MNNFSFNLFNSKWRVYFVDKIPADKDDSFIFRKTYFSEHKIKIATEDRRGNTIPESELKITLLHELMHVIFASGQYLSCNDDEPLVEWVANCIYTLLKQKKL